MTTVSTSLHRSARRWFRIMLLPVFALSLLAAMWLALLHQLEGERESTRKEATGNSQALARVLAEHVSNILRQTDHATQLFKLKYEETGGKLRLPEFARRNGLLDSVLPARLDLPIMLYDRHGRALDSAHAVVSRDVAAAPFFQALAKGEADAPMFTTPVVDARSKKWHIQVARRLNDRGGAFDGVIVIMIDPMYFVDDYDRLNLDDRDALTLTSREDGLSVGRIGEHLFIDDRLRFVPGRGPEQAPGELSAIPPQDAIARVYGASEMPRYGLTAVVGVTEAAAMARFRQHQRNNTGVAAFASVLIALVSVLLMRQSARLRASMRAAREAQAILRAASDGSLDGLMIFKASYGPHGRVEDFIVVDINERGAAMLRLPRAELLGQKAFALMPRFRQTGFMQRYIEVLESGQPLEEEVELHFEGEAPRWIHHQIVPLKHGVAVTSRDITARKQDEIEIRSNRGFLQSLIEHLPLLIYVKSVRPASFGTMMVWNKAAETVTGIDAARVIGHTDSSAFPPGFNLCSQDEDLAMLANPVVRDQPERPLRLADGSLRYLHAVSVPLFDQHGNTEYILCIAEDITQRRAQEQNLRTSEAQMVAVTNASPLGLVRADLNGDCTYVNRRFEAISGLTREQALGQGWTHALHPDDRTLLDQLFAHQRQCEEPFEQVLRCVHGDGKLVWVSLKVAAVRIGGRIEGFVGSLDDITTLREAELALRESEARVRTIADTMPAMVAYVDAAQVYRFRNLAYGREYEREGARVAGHTVRETVGDERYRFLAPYIARALAGETLVFQEQDNHGGAERTMEVTYIPQLGEDDATVVGFHVMRQDITSQQREKRRLLKLAQIDVLTGLANRAGFLSKLDSAMRDSAQHGRLMALMYMDIDFFKPVNDTYGHAVGDKLLKAFSARLTHALRSTDTVARLGGDEFTIIMEGLNRPDDAATAAAKIVMAMRVPFDLDGVTVSVSASVGLTYFRDGPHDPDALLKQADMLLYQAKQAGRNTYRAAA